METKTNNGTAITFSPLPFDGRDPLTRSKKAGDENGMNDPKTVTAITISKKDDQLESQITYVDDDGQENTVNMYNVYNEEPPTGGLYRKVDNETNEPLANAVFHVFDSENQRVKEDEIIKTDEDGVVRVDGLPLVIIMQ
ncbi:MAG: prealbumin-like fold domain-containing protein [Enterococcus sp.]|uniref:prealbumin-like fold domain-containing protein n=1 Tax=Enterococcus sp. TaxID=35783 RepID=UPI0039957EC0